MGEATEAATARLLYEKLLDVTSESLMEERICDKATENGFGFVDCCHILSSDGEDVYILTFEGRTIVYISFDGLDCVSAR